MGKSSRQVGESLKDVMHKFVQDNVVINQVRSVRRQDRRHISSMKFLVVDDQDSARKMLYQMVSSNPLWSVVGEATNGLEAIADISQRPDVVIMDIVMPEMDGLEATRQIKNLAPQTVVILTTAYQNHEFRRRSLEAGADAFLLKDNLTTQALQRILNNVSKQTKGGSNNE